MIALLRALFFCCNAAEETNKDIESVEKKVQSNKKEDKETSEKKRISKTHSQDLAEANRRHDSSESCSISSGV
jgi:ribosome-binding ATPase YchF (GTP1/OBG family)